MNDVVNLIARAERLIERIEGMLPAPAAALTELLATLPRS